MGYEGGLSTHSSAPAGTLEVAASVSLKMLSRWSFVTASKNP